MLARLAPLVALVLLAVAPASAMQTRIGSCTDARDRFFYKELYPRGGFTLCCGAWFVDRTGLNVEHVYPASWMKEVAGCAELSRQECRRVSPLFNSMEADLHNLYPTIAFVNQDRSNFRFAGIPGEAHAHEGCDFEYDRGMRVAEPRPEARGNVARAIFYMRHEYGLAIPPVMGPLLLAWHRADPVSAEERRRNDRIAELQGTRNAFIDNPDLAETLGLGQ